MMHDKTQNLISFSQSLGNFSSENNFYYQLFQSNPSPILICSEEGIVNTNPAALALFEVHHGSSLNGLQLSDLSPNFQPNGAFSQQMFRDLIQEASEKDTAHIECLCKKLSNGESFPVEIVVSLMRLEGGVTYQITLLDLSDFQHWKNALTSDKEIDKIEDGSLPPEEATLSDENKCRFGQWYKTDGAQQFGELEAFKRIDEAHLALHSQGDEIIQLYAGGQAAEAKGKCLELYEIKDRLLKLLDELQREAFPSEITNY